MSVSQFLGRALLTLFFPISCVGCGRYPDVSRRDTTNSDDSAEWLCAACRERILPSRSTCIVCGEATPTGRTCYTCAADTPIAGLVHVGPYRNPVLQSAIKRLKFNGIRALAGPLGDLLARQILAAGLVPATLVPLPLHPRRERERGYNQAHLLAASVGNALQLPVTDLLTRTRASSPQTSIIESPRARRRNVARAFALRSTGAPVRERIILIDDVLTTGATLSEAAAVLQTEGSSEIWGAVVARG